MDNTFSKYGQAFQLTTLSLFLKNKAFTNQIKDILNPEYFDNKYTRWICERSLEYLEKYKNFSSEEKIFEDLKVIIDDKIPEANKKLYLSYLKNIKETDLSNRTFVEEEVQNFCFSKHALLKCKEQENNILAGNFEKAKEVAFSAYKPLSSQCEEMSLKEGFRQLISEEQIHNPVGTPISIFNKYMKGGPGAADLVIVCGQSSLGKTAFLTATARQAAIDGKNVLYFSLETKLTQIASRAVAGLIGINQEDLKEHVTLGNKKIDELKGDIQFVRYPATKALTSTIKQKVDELKAQGFFPDLLIVDGLNQLKLPPGKRVVSDNEKFEYLAEELRDLGSELLCPVYAAFQSNRGGFNVEYADEQNIGKAIEVYQVCDIMVMLTQSLPMLEKGECFAQLLKNRLGKKGVTVRCSYDPNHGTFKEIEEVQRTSLLSNKEKTETLNTLEKTMEKIERLKHN